MSFYLFRKMIRRLPGRVIKAVKLPNPAVVEGFGARSKIGEICKKHGYASVLLVTDRTLFGLGFHEAVVQSLEANGVAYTVFSDIASEPTVQIVTEGRCAAVNCHAQCIVALGGGSVMDSSKIIAAGATRPKRDLNAFLHKFAFCKTLPMITVPSTAGTGAEITVGAVVKNAKGVKKSTVITGLQITDVILDSELTLRAPKNVTVACAVDALSHGLEGCLADVRVSKEDADKSRACVRLVFENLPELLVDPEDVERRQAMCLAAHYGGNAINKQLAGYVHAFAHTVGALYHLPHGVAIAYSLLPVVAAQKEICKYKLRDLSVYCGFADETADAESAVNAFMDKLAGLLRLCGLDGGCAELNDKDYPALIRGINADSINYSSSIVFSDRQIMELLDQIKGE